MDKIKSLGASQFSKNTHSNQKPAFAGFVPIAIPFKGIAAKFGCSQNASIANCFNGRIWIID
jgi:hypothetical protein